MAGDIDGFFDLERRKRCAKTVLEHFKWAVSVRSVGSLLRWGGFRCRKELEL